MRLLPGLLLASALFSADEPGFKPAFDGESLAGWSLLARSEPSGSWQARNGELVVEGRPGSLVSVDEYADFELRLEWMVGRLGNSGVYYRVTGAARLADAAIEYQLADNAREASKKFANRRAGAAYGLYAPSGNVVAPPEQWHSLRIVARGSLVEHWMNGQKVVEFDVGSEEFRRRAEAAGKSAEFGKSPKGKIVLQDHGGLAAFKNIRIRRLE